MNRKTKLLAVVVAILIALLSVETYAWQIMDKSSQTNPIRVAMVGDSITAETNYVNDLWLMLGSKYDLGNFGVNGATIYLKTDNPWVYAPAFKAAKQFEPQIVIIMLGTNDANPSLNETNAEFIQEYAGLVAQFQGLASKPKVWIAKPPPIFSNDYGLSGTYFAKNIIPDIEQVANSTGTPVIDIYNAMLSHSTYFPDGVHPDADGSVAIANATYSALTSKAQS
jgi:lysophospholipase L1-like esterase